VVVTSGYVKPEYLDEAARLGVAEVIRKPDTVDLLADTLDRIFSQGGPRSARVGAPRRG
jgi:DNA-binding NarL/FixJ family response regulator